MICHPPFPPAPSPPLFLPTFFSSSLLLPFPSFPTPFLGFALLLSLRTSSALCSSVFLFMPLVSSSLFHNNILQDGSFHSGGGLTDGYRVPNWNITSWIFKTLQVNDWSNIGSLWKLKDSQASFLSASLLGGRDYREKTLNFEATYTLVMKFWGCSTHARMGFVQATALSTMLL